MLEQQGSNLVEKFRKLLLRGCALLSLVALCLFCGCGHLFDPSHYGNRSSISIEDLGVVNDDLVIVLRKMDYTVIFDPVGDSLHWDRDSKSKFRHCGYYILRFPIKSPGGGETKSQSAREFYTAADARSVTFQIMSDGKFIRIPYMSTNGAAPSARTWNWSFTLYDPLTRSNCGPIYMGRKTQLCFNEARSLFVANARSSDGAEMQIDGQITGQNALYRTTNGVKLKDLKGFNFGLTYGITDWAKLTEDGSHYILFRKKHDIDTVEEGGQFYPLTNNLCVVEDLGTGNMRAFYTSNWVSHAEIVDGVPRFLSDELTMTGRKALLFDQEGKAQAFPGNLPGDFSTLHWDARAGKIYFATRPHIREDPGYVIPPLKIICWNYLENTTNEQELNLQKPIRALLKEKVTAR